MKRIVMSFVLFICLSGATGLIQAEETAPLKAVDISLDQATLKQGLGVFTDVCMGCHSLRYMTWKDLMDYKEIGLNRKAVDELRGDAPLNAHMMTGLALCRQICRSWRGRVKERVLISIRC